MEFYDLKQNDKYCYEFVGSRRYSQQLVDFVIEKIKEDPDIISKILAIKKKITPGS